MKFTVEVDPEDNPDAVGEFLRRAFFDEKIKQTRCGPYREVGCYQTFDWQRDVEPLPEIPRSIVHNHSEDQAADDLCWACSAEGETWKRGRKSFPQGNIECRYYWDGDGTLVFILPSLPSGKPCYLINDDCKKDHGWYLSDNLDLEDL